MYCQQCGFLNRSDAKFCGQCGQTMEMLPQPPPMPAEQAGDATGGLIPYKNPEALAAYYLGLFSLLPLVGFFLAIASLMLGIKGLKARKLNPIIKGSIHAWIGIIFGAVVILGHLALLILAISVS